MTRSFLPVPVADLGRAAGDLLVELRGDPATVVTGVAHDSRSVEEGSLFFCVPGLRSDGHDFAPAAAAAGAAALCVERPMGVGVPEVVVRDVRRAMPLVAAAALGRPADDLVVIGITGTNGKTTTAFLVESILRADGRPTGLLGTIEVHVGDTVRPGIRTTPESTDLQLLLHEMRAAGVTSVAMEVTSHGIVLHRIDGIRFAAAGFTNLSQDHLDFHGDMGAYFEAKRSLFTPERCEGAALNVDDPYGHRIAASAQVPVLTFGSVEEADVRATDVELGPNGSRFKAVTPKGEIWIDTSLVGPFNVSNCLAATALALRAGIGLPSIETGIRNLEAVPGRFESVAEGQPFTVVVDYAHTPDSLENVLNAGRRVAAARDGRVLCVFGCGGDRDRGKRPLMGMVAGRLADLAFVTSDNPRSEDPQTILGEIVEGFAGSSREPHLVEVDRRSAIAAALQAARPGDLVVIAGKGHETGQEFADRTVPFDDRVVAREVLRGLGWDETGARPPRGVTR